MKILQWFKDRKKAKIQEQEELYQKIKYNINNNFNTEKTGMISFEETVSELIQYKKGNYYLTYSSISTLNSQIKDLIMDMCLDYKFKNKVYNHIFKTEDGDEQNILSLICYNIELLNQDTQRFVLSAFPLELFNQPLQVSSVKKATIAGMLFLLDTNDFIIDLLKENKEMFFLNTKTQIYGQKDFSFIETIEDKFLNSDLNKYGKSKFNYIIPELKPEHFINQDYTRKILLDLISVKRAEYLSPLIDNDVAKEDDFPFIISALLSNFEKEKNIKKQNLIIDILKNIDKTKPDIFIDTDYISGYNLTDKTYSVCYDKLLKGESTPKNLYGLLHNIFFHSEKADFELFEKYCTEANFESDNEKKLMISYFFEDLNKKERLPFLENYINYYKEQNIGELNTEQSVWIKNILKNNGSAEESTVVLLKKNGINPFYQFSDSERIFDVVDKETQDMLTYFFLKEKADAEKEILIKSIGLEEQESVIIKKRL